MKMNRVMVVTRPMIVVTNHNTISGPVTISLDACVVNESHRLAGNDSGWESSELNRTKKEVDDA